MVPGEGLGQREVLGGAYWLNVLGRLQKRKDHLPGRPGYRGVMPCTPYMEARVSAPMERRVSVFPINPVQISELGVS